MAGVLSIYADGQTAVEMRRALFADYAWLTRYGHVSITEARKMTNRDRLRLRSAISELFDEENRAQEAGRRDD